MDDTLWKTWQMALRTLRRDVRGREIDVISSLPLFFSHAPILLVWIGRNAIKGLRRDYQIHTNLWLKKQPDLEVKSFWHHYHRIHIYILVNSYNGHPLLWNHTLQSAYPVLFQ